VFTLRIISSCKTVTDVWLFADDFEDVQVRVPVMLGTILEN